jgi:hypothetical protein
MTIAFRELAGSPLETFAPEGMKAQRRLVAAWEDRHALVAELLGQGYALGGPAPAAYPGRPRVSAARVRVEPWPPSPDNQGAFTDVAAQLNSYSGQFALLTIDYELFEEDAARGDLPSIEPDTFLTYRMDFGAEYEQWPAQALRWVSDPSLPVPPDAVPVLRVPLAEHHVTWHRVLNPPWAAIRQCVGTVNGAAFLGAAAETVLLDGATAEKQFLGVNELHVPQYGWRINYVFREKAIWVGESVCGWNHRFRHVPHASPGWDRLTDAAGGAVYRATDFAPLFLFAAGE